MPDLIRLLPDAVANQIAAGEVVQRPASVVKELLENSIDAGATQITLIIKDAGKTLIQVVDNGSGMSDTDARLSFERHSTSKITDANDLFAIKTMGFRGEALASIAAVAQVELKTKRQEDELGTHIIIEGSELKEQTICQTANGTSFSIKNLFFNIPARRKFLKSDKVEIFHIINEFQRVALAHPNIHFSMFQNNKQIFKLEELPLKQRIVNLFGTKAKEMLIPVDQETEVINISGYIGKPEIAKKRRGEQYFFVNNRFMRHHLFHRFIENAFEGLISDDAFPSYFLYFDIAPEKIDVNIHPTKTEIKFEDEQIIGATLRAAVRQAIGKFNILPTLDFEVEKSFDNIPKADIEQVKQPQIKIDPTYNPFEASSSRPPKNKNADNLKNWEKLFEVDRTEDVKPDMFEAENTQQLISSEWDNSTQQPENKQIFQVHARYIFSQIKSGVMIIDQQQAHERVLYEKYVQNLSNSSKATQGTLFPREIELSQHEIQIINSLQEELKLLGLDVKITGETTLMINGIPSDFSDKNPETLLKRAIESYNLNSEELEIDTKTNLAISLAKNLSIKPGQLLTVEEMQVLIDELFACEVPYASPMGKKVFYTLTTEDIYKNLN